MTVFQKAVTGFNNNVPRKGRSYHVQTEDSGINHPHIMTHLFLGGNIIASKKTSYRDILGAPDLAERVRAMMDEQHKEMMRNLLAGKYDAQAAQSVQLQAPKVEVLTPHQAPIRGPTAGAATASDAPSRSAACPAAPDGGNPSARGVAEKAPPPASATVPETAANSAPATAPAASGQAAAHLRRALISYLDYARAALGSATGG